MLEVFHLKNNFQIAYTYNTNSSIQTFCKPIPATLKDTTLSWRSQAEGFFEKPISRRQPFQRNRPKAEKPGTISEKQPLFPQE